VCVAERTDNTWVPSDPFHP